jgi:hypothetical protein
MDLMLRTRNTGKLNIDRVFARLFTLGGGFFWVSAFFVARSWQIHSDLEPYTLPELASAAWGVFIPFMLVVAVFVLSFFYERLTGIVLVGAALIMIGYGVVQHWGSQGIVLWVTAFSVLILPSLIAAALFELAARRQEAQVAEATVASAT